MIGGMVPRRSYSDTVTRKEFLDKVSFRDEDMVSLNDYPIFFIHREKTSRNNKLRDSNL